MRRQHVRLRVVDVLQAVFEAAQELMRNRDPQIWDTFIERLDAKGLVQ